MQRRPQQVSTENLQNFLAGMKHAEPWHNHRYVTTFEASWPVAQQAHRILDVGGRSPFTDLLEAFTAATVTCDSFDLRGPFPYEDEVFDVVFCLEVIEHLKDRDASNLGTLATFSFSGVRNCLDEIRRVLKPGGLLVLSTPNVCSYRSLRNALEHRHPFAFSPHNRELALSDVERLLTEARLSIERLSTINAWWNGGGTWWQWRLALMLWMFGHSTQNRHDDILALARRPLP